MAIKKIPGEPYQPRIFQSQTQGIHNLHLRDYQANSIVELRKKFASGTRRILLVAPTAAGKTLIFCEILRSAYQKGNPAIVVVAGRQLVDQASRRLDDHGVPHGVMMADHWRNLPHELIQVCSIATLHSRKIVPPATTIIIDEAHLANGAMYRWLIQHYQNSYFIAVTATPFLKKGMRHIADDLIHVATMKQLTDLGYLAPLKYYCPSVIDVSQVAIASTGDFNSSDLYKTVDKPKIYGDLVDGYRKILDGKTAIAYGVNIAHAKNICDSFNSAGIPCEFIDASVPLAARSSIIEKLQRREIKVIASVGTMTTGVDIPCLDGLIIARPTTSLNLHLQILGRAARISPGKEFGIVVDHAGNVIRHGLADQERIIELDGYSGGEKKDQLKTCRQCYAVFLPQPVCPACGHRESTAIAREGGLSHADSEMREMTETDLILLDFGYFEELRKKTKGKNGKRYHAHWTIHKLVAKYGKEKLKEVIPDQIAALDNAAKHRA